VAGPAPKTRSWNATEDRQPGPGRGPRLIVTGEVETSNSNQTPHLNKHVPPGINPKIEMLDLTISSSGQGNAVMGWKPVRYEEIVQKGQFSNVDILWEGKKIADATVKVVE
jgi:hypothetical protein